MEDQKGLNYTEICQLIGQLVLSNHLRVKEVEQRAESIIKNLQQQNEALTVQLAASNAT